MFTKIPDEYSTSMSSRAHTGIQDDKQMIYLYTLTSVLLPNLADTLFTTIQVNIYPRTCVSSLPWF